MDILEKSKMLLLNRLEGNHHENNTIHPWRKGWKHTYLHCLRVNSIAVKIAKSEKDNLSSDEFMLIELSAILHDIGKSMASKNHAEKSVEIVEKWLNENPSISSQISDIPRLIKIIRNHSDKDMPDDDLCSLILKDADVLDEIGILSIFMASNRVDRDSPLFFNELKSRLETFELAYCSKKMKLMRTKCGMEMLEHKTNFILQFIEELNMELEGNL